MAAVLVLYCLLCTSVAGTTAVLFVALSEQFGAVFDILLDSGRQFSGSQADAEVLAVCRSAED